MLDAGSWLYNVDRGSEELDVVEAMCDGGRYTLSGCWLPTIITLSGLIPTCDTRIAEA